MPYGLKKTEEIERQLPVLLEYIRVTPKPDFIPQPVASASTILYAIQECLISRSGKVFRLVESACDLPCVIAAKEGL
jgi:hypothetical protein